MKHSLISLVAAQAAITAENRALREEVAKLRERVAVLERQGKAPMAWDFAKLGVPHIGTPMPFYGQPQWVNPAPAASPCVPRITC